MSVHLDSNHDEHDSPNIYQAFPHHSPNMILWCNQLTNIYFHVFFPKCQGFDFARAHFPASSPPDFPRRLRPWNRPSPCNARWSCAWLWLHRSWWKRILGATNVVGFSSGKAMRNVVSNISHWGKKSDGRFIQAILVVEVWLSNTMVLG